MEGDRISPLKSDGQMLEEECSFPGVLCDGGDAPANLVSAQWPCSAMWQLSIYGRWIENVSAGQFGILVNLVLCCLMGCCTWFSSCAVPMLGLLCMCYYYYRYVWCSTWLSYSLYVWTVFFITVAYLLQMLWCLTFLIVVFVRSATRNAFSCLTRCKCSLLGNCAVCGRQIILPVVVHAWLVMLSLCNDSYY